MSEVAAVLGEPDNVSTSGTTESSDYCKIAYEPLSERTVRNLQIWVLGGMVGYMTAMF